MPPRARWKFSPAQIVPRQWDSRVTELLVFLGTEESPSIPICMLRSWVFAESSVCSSSSGQLAQRHLVRQQAKQWGINKRFGSLSDAVGNVWGFRRVMG